MASRLNLQTKLEELLESRNVYYQPPENIKMNYPAIKYQKDNVTSKHADDRKYLQRNRYEIIVIDYEPDNPVINKILELPNSSFNRSFISDNLVHEVLTLYY